MLPDYLIASFIQNRRTLVRNQPAIKSSGRVFFFSLVISSMTSATKKKISPIGKFFGNFYFSLHGNKEISKFTSKQKINSTFFPQARFDSFPISVFRDLDIGRFHFRAYPELATPGSERLRNEIILKSIVVFSQWAICSFSYKIFIFIISQKLLLFMYCKNTISLLSPSSLR